MDFTLSEDQELLRSSARSMLAKECPPSLLRAHIDDRAAVDPLWRHLSEWTELGASPLVDLCLFLESTGEVSAPGPFLATSIHAGSTVNRTTSPISVAGAAWPLNHTSRRVPVLGSVNARPDSVSSIASSNDGFDRALIAPSFAMCPAEKFFCSIVGATLMGLIDSRYPSA